MIPNIPFITVHRQRQQAVRPANARELLQLCLQLRSLSQRHPACLERDLCAFLRRPELVYEFPAPHGTESKLLEVLRTPERWRIHLQKLLILQVKFYMYILSVTMAYCLLGGLNKVTTAREDFEKSMENVGCC